MFSDPSWTALKMKTTRYFFPWNGMSDAYQRDRARTFVEAAQAKGVSVLFHLSTDDYRAGKAKLPTVAQYRAQLRRIVPYFHARACVSGACGMRPTTSPSPRTEARGRPRCSSARCTRWFRAPTRSWHSTCSIRPAGSIATSAASSRPSLRSTAARAKIVGLHNYSDVNRTRAHDAAHDLNGPPLQRRLRFWFTETGALVEFGRGFPCSTGRAAIRLPKVFSIAKQFRGQGVDRVLLYNWYGPGCGKARFDAGLVNARARRARPTAPSRACSRLLSLSGGRRGNGSTLLTSSPRRGVEQSGSSLGS